MGRKRTPGLFKRGEFYHVDKQILGRRICESTGERSLTEAERYLTQRVEQIRQAQVYGIRPQRTFREAGVKYVLEAEIVCLADDVARIKILDPYIGQIPLDRISMDALRAFIENRRRAGAKSRTINLSLQVVRRIVNLAAGEWVDEHGLTWLHVAPKIKMLRIDDAREPYPLSWEEQKRLFRELPEHLRRMALFKVNTGTRDQEVCGLRWEWEVAVPELDTSVFIIPAGVVKNRRPRLVVLNRIAREVIGGVRGEHPEYVFTYRGRPVGRMLNSAWKAAREAAGLPHVRVHDLKHTFGRRLRAAGVSFEDRQDLLGHVSTRITTHYSAAELGNLIAAANKVCGDESRKNPALVMLKAAI